MTAPSEGDAQLPPASRSQWAPPAWGAILIDGPATTRTVDEGETAVVRAALVIPRR